MTLVLGPILVACIQTNVTKYNQHSV